MTEPDVLDVICNALKPHIPSNHRVYLNPLYKHNGDFVENEIQVVNIRHIHKQTGSHYDNQHGVQIHRLRIILEDTTLLVTKGYEIAVTYLDLNDPNSIDQLLELLHEACNE